MKLKIKKLREDAQLPAYATPGAAAMDLVAACGDEGVVLEPMQRAVIPTGIAIELPGPEYIALVFARSSMGAKRGVALSNGVGVIDSDYRGEIGVAVVNLSGERAVIAKGERIAQLAVVPVARAEIEQAQTLADSERGAGGFGSTGRF